MQISELIESLQWRYATKEFDATKKISTELWSSIEESLVLTPSCFGLQPWKFIVVTDEEVKKKLLPHSWNQRQIVDCSHLVVLTAQAPITMGDLDSYVDTIAEARGAERESLQFYRDLMGGFVAKMDAVAI